MSSAHYSASQSTCSSCPTVGECVNCPTCDVKQCIGDTQVNNAHKPYCTRCVARDSLEHLAMTYHCKGCQKKRQQPPLVCHGSLRTVCTHQHQHQVQYFANMPSLIPWSTAHMAFLYSCPPGLDHLIHYMCSALLQRFGSCPSNLLVFS
jgi:hypothetical protein